MAFDPKIQKLREKREELSSGVGRNASNASMQRGSSQPERG